MQTFTEQTRCAGSDVQVPQGTVTEGEHSLCPGCLVFVPVQDFDGIRFVEHSREILYAAPLVQS